MRPGPTSAKRRTPAQVFKPWIVRRPDGGCQVLFPLTELDRLLDEAIAIALENEEEARE